MNTRPMLHGIRKHPVMDAIELVEDYPARIAQLLIDDELDLGLVPVAATLKLKEWHLLTDYCIGCDGAVASVCIFSEVPIEEVTAVYLDYQSRTSVNLAKVLLRDYWKKEVLFLDASGEDYRDRITGTVAGVVIGDRALQQRERSTFIYDLGEAWKKHTGLPFVFAGWVANKQLPEELIRQFNEANAQGLQEIDAVVAQHEVPYYDLAHYYKHNIRYNLDEAAKAGMQKFLELLRLGV